ncbi:hypothetical protein B0T14DRAFT_306982 [Immersiella caudata]|uniref:Uncharacterized protein n=1 Tax=Immersiella caudata TaxID=314043 RepID=A0AA40BUP4_9PEZI|nr:hypothetical protein B0T14DRAFT_306982 [Immersiella caudata]
MCNLTILRNRCGCNTLLRLSCTYNNSPHVCPPPHRHTLLNAQTIIHSCAACHDLKWDALDESRLSEFDDHQSHMSRTLSHSPGIPLESRRLLYRDVHLEDNRAEAVATATRQEGERKIAYTATWFRWYSSAVAQLCSSPGAWADAKVWANFRWLQVRTPPCLVVRLDRRVVDVVRKAACFHARERVRAFGSFTMQERRLLRGIKDGEGVKRLAKGFVVRKGDGNFVGSACGSCGQATPVPELMLGGGDEGVGGEDVGRDSAFDDGAASS